MAMAACLGGRVTHIAGSVVGSRRGATGTGGRRVKAGRPMSSHCAPGPALPGQHSAAVPPVEVQHSV